jgi:peptidoglycan/LPS O-acetylase OafA/YrhL
LLLPPVILAFALHLPIRQWESWVGGDYSYGLYLYGYPTAQLAAFLGLQQWGYPTFFAVNLAAAAACAVISWHGLEKPALNLKGSRTVPS